MIPVYQKSKYDLGVTVMAKGCILRSTEGLWRVTAREGTIQIISVAGKTYSLFGSGPSTGSYYWKIGTRADRMLEESPDVRDLSLAP